MLDLHCLDTPYVNIIISAYSLVNIMLEAISSSQNLQYLQPSSFRKTYVFHIINKTWGQTRPSNQRLIKGKCPKESLQL